MEQSHSNIEFHPADTQTSLSLPYASEGIKAGFPSPSQDYMDISIDLNKELIKHPASTFFGRVSGDSMLDADLEDGDILIVDKSLEPVNGDTAVCFIDGEFTIKYIRIEEDEVIWLYPANPDYKPIKVTPQNDFIIWGIVTYSIRSHKPKRRKK
jgi:DNA polymerase V